MTGLVAKAGAGAVLGPVGAFLGKIPSWAYLALGIALAALLGALFHHHAVSKHDAALVKSTTASVNAAWQKAFDKEREAAAIWKQGFDQNAVALSNSERKIHDQAVADNAAAADALRLRGPGAASAAHCGQVDNPGAPSAPDRHDQAAAGAGPPAAQVPSDDRAIVPWSWLVQVVQEHDDLRADVESIIVNDQKQRQAWPTNPPASVPR